MPGCYGTEPLATGPPPRMAGRAAIANEKPKAMAKAVEPATRNKLAMWTRKHKKQAQRGSEPLQLRGTGNGTLLQGPGGEGKEKYYPTNGRVEIFLSP